MAEFFLDTEVAEQHEAAAGEPGTLAMTVDEFSALEERVLRAVNLVKRERIARAEAEQRAAAAEAQAAAAESRLAEQAQNFEKVESEMSALRSERDQVRQRVERILSQFDALEV